MPSLLFRVEYHRLIACLRGLKGRLRSFARGASPGEAEKRPSEPEPDSAGVGNANRAYREKMPTFPPALLRLYRMNGRISGLGARDAQKGRGTRETQRFG